MLVCVCDGCFSGEFVVLVIGLVYKGNINDVGIVFIGYIEFFEECVKVSKVVMMLVIEELWVVLVIIYLLLKVISEVIIFELLCEIIIIFDYDLCMKFGIVQLYVLVCGFNLYVGEGGYMGIEEIDIIILVLEEMCVKGMNFSGLLLVDIFFQLKYFDYVDVVFVMYYDQGLFVLKYQGFGCGVNIMFGLFFICIFVDYGIVLELVGQGKVDVGSFIMVFNFVIKMIVNI